MILQEEKVDNKVKITFIPETEEERLIMGNLRNHYFFGLPENGTFPKYEGVTSENNYVTSMIFMFNTFK